MRCNNINDPMAKLCVPDIVRDMNIKVFNLLARINETRKVVWHETCKCVCRLTSAVCNDRQEWNENKCRCECKEDLINKLVCDKGLCGILVHALANVIDIVKQVNI